MTHALNTIITILSVTALALCGVYLHLLLQPRQHGSVRADGRGHHHVNDSPRTGPDRDRLVHRRHGGHRPARGHRAATECGRGDGRHRRSLHRQDGHVAANRLRLDHLHVVSDDVAEARSAPPSWRCSPPPAWIRRTRTSRPCGRPSATHPRTCSTNSLDEPVQCRPATRWRRGAGLCARRGQIRVRRPRHLGRQSARPSGFGTAGALVRRGAPGARPRVTFTPDASRPPSAGSH